MPERIGVIFDPVMFEGRHLAIFYERADGEKTVIEAWGANKDTLTFSQKAGGAIQDAWRLVSDNFGSPWGIIVGPGATGERAWDPVADGSQISETLLTGNDLSAKWGALETSTLAALAAHYEYRPFSQNSNTFIATILEDAGVPLPTGAPVGMTLIPGFQYRLHNPLGNVSYPATSLDATDFIFSDPNGTTTKIVVGDPVTITLTWGAGTLSLDIDGQSETNQIDTVTSITAADGHVIRVGSEPHGSPVTSA